MISPSDRCYRHQDHPASVGCQRCGRPICSECMKPASVGFHCPECAKSGQQKVIKGIPGRSNTDAPVTMALIAINVLVFLGQQVTDGASLEVSDGLTSRGILWGPLVQDGEFWRIFTAGFLHGSFLHLGFNMYVLYMLGPYVERLAGSIRFVLFYLISLFGGSAAVLFFNWLSPTLGASGAVLGLAGVIAGQQLATGRSLREIPALSMIMMNLALPIIMSSISFWGHFGGIVAGALAGYAMHRFHWMPTIKGKVEYLIYAGAAVGLFGLGLLGAASGSF